MGQRKFYGALCVRHCSALMGFALRALISWMMTAAVVALAVVADAVLTIQAIQNGG